MPATLPLILIVDDNADDIVFTKRLLATAHVGNPISEIQDGEDAIKFLKLAIEEGDLPGVVFMDINMPRVSGFDVLAWAREQDRLRAVPIVMLTSSDDERDQRKAKSLRASAYLIKHPSADVIGAVVRAACGNVP